MRRLRACVEQWPEAETGGYNPSCCRFPKSCSADVYDEAKVGDDDLEAQVWPEVTEGEPMTKAIPFAVGDVIHGFAFGAFGRDSYACRWVEHVGPEWIVTRNGHGVEKRGDHGEVEFCTALRAPTVEQAACRDWCWDGCTGPEVKE